MTSTGRTLTRCRRPWPPWPGRRRSGRPRRRRRGRRRPASAAGRGRRGRAARTARPRPRRRPGPGRRSSAPSTGSGPGRPARRRRPGRPARRSSRTTTPSRSCAPSGRTWCRWKASIAAGGRLRARPRSAGGDGVQGGLAARPPAPAARRSPRRRSARCTRARPRRPACGPRPGSPARPRPAPVALARAGAGGREVGAGTPRRSRRVSTEAIVPAGCGPPCEIAVERRHGHRVHRHVRRCIQRADAGPELSSMATALDDIRRRVTAIAEAGVGDRLDWVAEQPVRGRAVAGRGLAGGWATVMAGGRPSAA